MRRWSAIRSATPRWLGCAEPGVVARLQVELVRALGLLLSLHLAENATEPDRVSQRELHAPSRCQHTERSPHPAVIEDFVNIELVVERYQDERRDRTGNDGHHHHASKLGLVLQEAWVAFDNHAPPSLALRLNQGLRLASRRQDKRSQ